MTKSKAACLAFALTMALSPGAALALDGNDVLRTCENTSGYNEGFCLGYLLGVVDSLMNGAAPLICNNDRTGNVTFAQMRDIVLKYLRDHPENRHCGAIDITYVALRNLFPCGGKPVRPVPASLC
jgi:Rap1a immunity proteins